MDILRRLIAQPNSQHEPFVMRFLCSLSSNHIAFEIDNLFFRGNLEDKLLFQQSPSMDMGIVRLEHNNLVFIPIGGTTVRFTITKAVILTNESSEELSPSILSQLRPSPTLKY